MINKYMSEDVQYVNNWQDEATQCKNCKMYQSQDNKNACVPEDMTFAQAIEKFGEASLDGHCNYFEAK